MTTYNTGNPLGSSDPRDLYDNAENLDNLVNGEQPAYGDRLGQSRKSWKSVEDQVAQQAAEFDAAQSDREGVFNAYLVSAGYVGTGANGDVENYAAGIEITQYNQVVRDTSGEFWRLSGSTALPYTTTGAGLPEGGAFVAVGDAVLRQELAANTGAAMVGTTTGDSVETALSQRVIYVGSVGEMLALDTAALANGQQVRTGEQAGGVLYPRSAVYAWRSSAPKASHDGFRYHSPTVPAPAAGSVLPDYWAASEETDPSGSGVFELTDNYELAHSGIPYVDDVISGPYQDSIIRDFLGSLPEDFDGVITARRGHKFLLENVVSALPSSAQLVIDGAQAAHVSPTYRVKKSGLATGDLVNDDTIYAIQSGHHPAIELTNIGTSGSNSAAVRIASQIWRTPNSGDGTQGRPSAMFQFQRVSGASFWSYTMRPYKPWAAIENDYTVWQSGVSYESGDIVRASNRFYRAVNPGTSGATQPVHDFGVDSDGGVDWEHILTSDVTCFQLTENGRTGICGPLFSSDAVTIRAPIDQTGLRVGLYSNRGGVVQLPMVPRDAANNNVSTPTLIARTSGVVGYEAPGGAPLISVDNNGVYYRRKRHQDITVSGATPSVDDIYSVRFNSADPQTVTNFITSIPNQEIEVMNVGSGAVTLSGGAFVLEGGAPLVLTQYSVVRLRKISGITVNWVEIGRSIK